MLLLPHMVLQDNCLQPHSARPANYPGGRDVGMLSLSRIRGIPRVIVYFEPGARQ